MYLDYHPDDIDVKLAELLVATSDGADALISPLVQQVLRALRERMGMDYVFVSQMVDGRRVFRAVDGPPGQDLLQPGQSDPLEESWCQHVLDGRLPQFVQDARPWVAAGKVPDPGIAIGTHISTPVLLDDGRAYGTLCCFSHDVKPRAGELDLRRLQWIAQLLAQRLQGQASAAGGGHDFGATQPASLG